MPVSTFPLAVLWDLDGVLVDTAEFHYQAWSQALAEIGVTLDRPTFHNLFGRNNASTVEGMLGYLPTPELFASLTDRKETLFRRAIGGQAKTLPGVRAWLARLQVMGIPQAVASSAPQANIDVLVDELGLRGYFAVLVPGDGLPTKPDPTIFLVAAQALGMPPQSVGSLVVIEDSPAGLEAARLAGMKCIAVATTNPATALGAADWVVERLDRLPLDIFDSYNSEED